MTFATELREGLAIAWDAIRANKLRSVLATLGIVIGVVTVTLMGTAIQGLNQSFLNSVTQLGTDVLYIQKFSWFTTEEEWWKVRNRRNLLVSQARTLERQATLARAVVPESYTRVTITCQQRKADNVMVVGTTENDFLARGFTIAQGRFLSAAEAQGGRPVCVLGADVATNFFPRGSPIGEKLKLGEISFEVIGVMAPMEKFLGMGSDYHVIIPITQLVTHFFAFPQITILVKVADLQRLEDAKEEVRGIMRKIRRLGPTDPDDFAINQQDAFIKMFRRVGGTIATVGLFITGLSLFVGGIGIMNIMFVSVAERTREIGIRKAIGAKRRTILLQFLSEAASICLLGGLVALAIAYPLTLVMGRFLPATLSIPVVLIALGVSLLTGVISGFMPAYRAAKMNPVDALRHE